MASPVVTWQLRKIGARLRARREELEVIAEQLMALEDGADEEAMQRHRGHVLAEIKRLEAKQDALLERM
ncbi:MAG: hypothetical protein Q7V57_05700 [Actinomycetota bacterium]|nr:hypothetical protein [Actinomycetota bacterium]